jgi:hypothetical protein
MWLTHWRPSVNAAERSTLSRRLYLYGSLLGSVLALLASGAMLLYRLLGLVLTTSQSDSGAAVVDIGRAVSVMVVALVLGLYHWRVLRSDAALRPAVTAEEGEKAEAFNLEISGASEADIRRALSELPGGASYKIVRKA